jgi:hypothetical protein
MIRGNIAIPDGPERRLAVTATCAIAYLLCGGLALGAEGTFDGGYVGKRVRTKGPTPPCVAEENVSVTIHGGTLSFTDSALRNIVIGFEPHQDGSFERIYKDIGGGMVLIEGRIVGACWRLMSSMPLVSITGVSRRAEPMRPLAAAMLVLFTTGALAQKTWCDGWGLSCGDAAETAGFLPDLHHGGAFGEPARGGQGGVIGDAVDAVAGDDVVGCVELIEAILGHRAPPPA